MSVAAGRAEIALARRRHENTPPRNITTMWEGGVLRLSAEVDEEGREGGT